jgi:hypothetical protein
VNNSGKPLLAQRLLAPEVNEIFVKPDESTIHTVFIPIHRFFHPSSIASNHCTAALYREKIIHSFSG